MDQKSTKKASKNEVEKMMKKRSEKGTPYGKQLGSKWLPKTLQIKDIITSSCTKTEQKHEKSERLRRNASRIPTRSGPHPARGGSQLPAAIFRPGPWKDGCAKIKVQLGLVLVLCWCRCRTEVAHHPSRTHENFPKDCQHLQSKTKVSQKGAKGY